ncbi:MAG: SprB repeat-containing protein [Bacteroidota bacterium]|nr:MAG: SprB repeat-containing protein [Bacteroidota bacterium]
MSTSVTLTEPATNITIGSASVTSNYSGAQLSCSTSTDGEITISASGGTGAIQYNIDGGSYQSSGVFTGLAAGTHTLIARDANNCTATTTVTITAPSGVVINSISKTLYNMADLSCHNSSDGELTVSASGGTGALTYSLNGGSYGSSNIFSALSAGTYTISVKDANNCATSATISINPPAAIVINSANKTLYNGSDRVVRVL